MYYFILKDFTAEHKILAIIESPNPADIKTREFSGVCIYSNPLKHDLGKQPEFYEVGIEIKDTLWECDEQHEYESRKKFLEENIDLFL
jgi:hypothetical protein